MIIIEDVKSGSTFSGLVAEARIRNGEGKVSYYSVVEVDGILLFFDTNESRFEKEINEDYDPAEKMNLTLTKTKRMRRKARKEMLR